MEQDPLKAKNTARTKTAGNSEVGDVAMTDEEQRGRLVVLEVFSMSTLGISR